MWWCGRWCGVMVGGSVVVWCGMVMMVWCKGSVV